MDPVRIEQVVGKRAVHVLTFPPREATFAPIPTTLPPKIRDWLESAGIQQLYAHQAESFAEFRAGNDQMVVTGTGSGKSLCYLLPALTAAIEEPAARCLFLFPTKALAQDQLGKIEQLIPRDYVIAATYDGDTAKSARAAIRKQAALILSNPDMLHLGILPAHETWGRFLKNLRLIVVDECHTYRGAFGGHVGWILRRLLRLCAWYGSRPQIIACSATIQNPVEHFKKLTGRSPTLVDRDGSPQGEKQVAVVEAPDLAAGEAASPNWETAALLAEGAFHGVKTMAFCRSRNGVELVLRMAQEEIEKRKGKSGWVDAYRGGYFAAQRRAIEKRLFRGGLRGIATTNAMELGVDVGDLDFVILNGYPGSRASFWQQAGRAGRAGRTGVALMLAHADPLEQFLARNLGQLRAEVEPCLASIHNPVIATRQIRCAAYERPIGPDEVQEWSAAEVAGDLLNAGELVDSVGRLYYPSHKAPAADVNIRNADADSVRLYRGDELLGDMERWRAMQYAHVGAVYIHRGETFMVTAADFDQSRADVEPFRGDFYTTPIVQGVIEPLTTIEQIERPKATFKLEAVRATSIVSGYRKLALKGGIVLGEEALEPQTRTIETVALRISPEWGIRRGYDMESDQMLPAIHAVEHAVGAVAPLICGCDRRDLGTAWYLITPDAMRPAIYLYDLAPGGLGLAEHAFGNLAELLDQAHQLISGCACDDGCPFCILSAMCESNNQNLSKSGAIVLLQELRTRLGQA